MTAVRQLTGFRLVQTRYNDTLQAIAARELGDAARWTDIVTINGLIYPYLTNDPAAAGDGVKLSGQLIMVPAATSEISAVTDPDRVFGVDLKLTKGKLTVVGGDLEMIGGRANLRQAILNRLSTRLGELLFHLGYGNGAWRLLGAVNGPTAGLLAAQYARGAMLSDPRVQLVLSTSAAVQGDQITVTGSVQPIAGTPIDLADVVL